MSRNRALIIGLSAVILFGHTIVATRAQELPTRKILPLALAVKAADRAVAACAAKGFWVSAAVVDRSGVVLAVLRHADAGPHTVDSATKKAYTAASLRRATLGFANFIAGKPAIHGLRFMNENILILGGGLPIKAGKEVIGGIGVGGAPGGDKDQACARAGIDKIRKRLK